MDPLLTIQAHLDTIRTALRRSAASINGARQSHAALEELLQQAPDPGPPPLGRPREPYARVVNVIPADATESQAIAIFLSAWCASRQTVTGSYDEAGLGALEDKTAVLWQIPDDLQDTFVDFYAHHYPHTRVEFRSVPEPTGCEGTWNTRFPPRPGVYVACLWLGGDLTVPVVARWSGSTWLNLLPADPVLCWRYLTDEDGENQE
jgi:hypothetical protein